MDSQGSNNETKVMLYAVDNNAKLASKCVSQLLKMKKLKHYHFHVTTTNFNEDDEFWSDNIIIKHLNTRLFLHHADVTSNESVKATINKIIDITGKIDALVCNISERLPTSAAKQNGVSLSSVYELNFYPHVRFISQVIPHMGAYKGGHIIVTNSYASIQGLPYLSAFSSSRFALEGYLQAVAAEVASREICVSIIQTALPKLDGNVMDLKRSTIDGHIVLSDIDRVLIGRMESTLQKQKLMKPITAGKITHCIYNILNSENPLLRVYANKSCLKAGQSKFIDPNGLETLTEVTKFFLNVDITECRSKLIG